MLSREQLYDMYITKRMTMLQIAETVKENHWTISKWINNYKIQTRNGREAQLPVEPSKEQLLDLYCTQLKSIDTIANELGCSEANISNLLKRYDIRIRSKTELVAGHNKGKPCPEWQKRILSDCAKKRIGPKSPRFGVQLTQETKDKIANSLKGRYRGRLNPKWKEDAIHRWRASFHHTYEYKSWRKQVFQRDGYSCKACGKPSNGDIQAHHIQPLEFSPELIFDVANGITLCRKCHRSIKGKEIQFVEMFSELVSDSSHSVNSIP